MSNLKKIEMPVAQRPEDYTKKFQRGRSTGLATNNEKLFGQDPFLAPKIGLFEVAQPLPFTSGLLWYMSTSKTSYFKNGYLL